MLHPSSCVSLCVCSASLCTLIHPPHSASQCFPVYSPSGYAHCLLRAEMQVGVSHVSCGAIPIYSLFYIFVFAGVCAPGVKNC